ncbi:translation initiation factor [Candidatus Woesearchaeota archaeon]|nr:translation initiation factor [Candidatus Woesearchaeota archaeon]
MTICARCGLPSELCVCESIAKETLKINISVEKKKFGKQYTIINGIDEKDIDIVQLAKDLKAKLACGGTIRNNQIELQGNHKQKVKEILLEKGFAPESIVIQ